MLGSTSWSKTHEDRQLCAAAIWSNRRFANEADKRGGNFGGSNSQLCTHNCTLVLIKSVPDKYRIERHSNSSLIDFKSSAAAKTRPIGNAGSGDRSAGNNYKFADLFISNYHTFSEPNTLLPEHCSIPNPNENFVYILNLNNKRQRPCVESIGISRERTSSWSDVTTSDPDASAVGILFQHVLYDFAVRRCRYLSKCAECRNVAALINCRTAEYIGQLAVR